MHVNLHAGPAWGDTHFIQWITTIIVMIHAGLGVAIITGGKERFHNPSYKPLYDFAADQIWMWGLAIIVSGVLMSIPYRNVSIIGCWLGMFWHIIWMTVFVVAVFNSPNAAATAIPVYGGLALICAALLTAKVLERPRD